MAAATKPRNTPRLQIKQPGRIRNRPVAAGVICYEGALAAITTTGFAVPATADATLIVVGVFKQTVDNRTGGNGDADVDITNDSAFGFASGTGSDEITGLNVDDDVYALDDQTVGLTDDGGARPVAGKVYEVRLEPAAVVYVDIP